VGNNWPAIAGILQSKTKVGPGATSRDGFQTGPHWTGASAVDADDDVPVRLLIPSHFLQTKTKRSNSRNAAVTETRLAEEILLPVRVNAFMHNIPASLLTRQ